MRTSRWFLAGSSDRWAGHSCPVGGTLLSGERDTLVPRGARDKSVPPTGPSRWGASLILAGLALGVACLCSVAAEEKDKRTDSAKDIQDLVVLTDLRPVLVRLHVTIDGKPFQTVWEEFVASMFKSLDRDGDGFLNADEAIHTPPAGVLFATAWPRSSLRCE